MSAFMKSSALEKYMLIAWRRISSYLSAKQAAIIAKSSWRFQPAAYMLFNASDVAPK